MIQASAALRNWLQENNIDPTSVRITLSADPITADRIGRAIGKMKADMMPLPTDEVSIREGHIYGIPFSITDKP